MKRFHVHIRVDDISTNIDFYTQLFSQTPTKIESDYAKWILDDPRLNFAISNHGEEERGISHLGVEFEDKQEFSALQQHQLSAVVGQQVQQAHANCCYAHSKKHWLLDPQQVPWEIFHTFDSSEEYGFSDTKNTLLKDEPKNE